MSDREAFESLSIEARTVAAAWFAMMSPKQDSRLQFSMIENRPTAKSQKGLDDLVAAGFISRKIHRRTGAVEYRPLKDMRALTLPLTAAFLDGKPPPGSSFRLVEPINSRREVGAP